ncbi:MAG: DUF485 domain-containing protein [Burkholderiales bacterium]
MAAKPMDWVAIDKDPRFQELHTKKTTFLWTLMVISVVYYFLLPIGAGYFPELFKKKIWGPVNVGILFALSEFLVAWFIAFYYARVASRRFDPMSDDILRSAGSIGGEK